MPFARQDAFDLAKDLMRVGFVLEGVWKQDGVD
jgi:hypothetical protein